VGTKGQEDSLLDKMRELREAYARVRLRHQRTPRTEAPGVICPYLRDPRNGDTFRCYVHRDVQAQADHDDICRKSCLPAGGPFKQTAKAHGKAPANLRGLVVPKGRGRLAKVDLPRKPWRFSPFQRPPPPVRQKVFGRRVA
jgi:hypothetical protein